MYMPPIQNMNDANPWLAAAALHAAVASEDIVEVYVTPHAIAINGAFSKSTRSNIERVIRKHAIHKGVTVNNNPPRKISFVEMFKDSKPCEDRRFSSYVLVAYIDHKHGDRKLAMDEVAELF